MNRGKALQIGTPVEIYERPNNRFVADFIGETNFLSGVVKATDGEQATLHLDAFDIDLVGMRQGDLHAGQAATISIRPEKVRLADHQGLNYNCLPARVVNTVYIGSDTRVIIAINEKLRMKVWEQNKISTLDPSAYYSPGQEVWATLFPENTLILPEQ
jgi:spermidine/putrescine transport system ATP-binding protein